ncbi:MAG: hypothetical protein ABGX38_05650 [Thermoleophilia bacterium]
MKPVAVIGRIEARGISRRRWPMVLLLVGAAIIIAGAVVAAGRDGAAGIDTMRSWTVMPTPAGWGCRWPPAPRGPG